MDRLALRVVSLTRAYARRRRRVTAVDRVSFGVAGGDIVAVVGRNGAGKSTLLRVLAGILRPTSGEAWAGNAHVGSPEARARIGFAFDPAEIPSEITGTEWLRYLASHHARLPPQRLRAVRRAIEIGQLHEFADRRVGQYSRGMAQRLATAAAVIAGREIILLDETLNGLDPLVARDLRESLRDLAAGGRAILVATHDLATVERLAHRVLVLHRGRLLLDQAVSSLVSERFLEIVLNGDTNRHAPWLMARFPDTVRTGFGVRVPLRRGVSAELVLAICRSESVPVLGSRVRYRELEDLLEEVTRERAGLPVS